MKKFRMPTAYTILFLLLILVAAATWVIPAGAYQAGRNKFFASCVKFDKTRLTARGKQDIM